MLSWEVTCHRVPHVLGLLKEEKMKRFARWFIGLTVFVTLFVGQSVLADTPMYRVYNPNSGEHFYTASTYERDSLGRIGWHKEGVGWLAPSSGQAVHRLYNPNSGDHHYTLSGGEKNHLVKLGWRYEGIAWQSGGTVPVYRLYNPNARTGTHHYTLSAGERDSLVKIGWRYEGISWYAIGNGAEYADANSYSPVKNSNSGSNSSGGSTVGVNPDGMVFVARNGEADAYWYRIENMPYNTNFNRVIKMSEADALASGKHHSKTE